jgi:hypothetical protein
MLKVILSYFSVTAEMFYLFKAFQIVCREQMKERNVPLCVLAEHVLESSLLTGKD